MKEKETEELATQLYQAWRDATPIPPITGNLPNLTINDAYRVQEKLIDKRTANGAAIIGRKIGATSKAVMDLLKVDQPDFGVLLDDMVTGCGEEISASTLISPRIEGEIAFVLKKDLQGPGVTSVDVLTATEGLVACFEIVDSRIVDWKITIHDTIADNASCGRFVLSDRMVKPSSFNMYSCGMVLEKNGHIVGLGAGAATMGSPVNAVVWLANTLGRMGVGLKAGEVILSGALSSMIDVSAGDFFRMEIGGLGDCSVRFS